MKLKYAFEIVNMGEEQVAVPVGENAGNLSGVLKLNPEGAEILDMLKQDTTEDNIVNVLSTKYENDRDELGRYVHDIVRKFFEIGILE